MLKPVCPVSALLYCVPTVKTQGKAKIWCFPDFHKGDLVSGTVEKACVPERHPPGLDDFNWENPLLPLVIAAITFLVKSVGPMSSSNVFDFICQPLDLAGTKLHSSLVPGLFAPGRHWDAVISPPRLFFFGKQKGYDVTFLRALGCS